ncbi:MAG TPA: NYN domain-containing protein [Actinophytocola sp.]|uniref:NYN domain-containing protein n=1 Tax=Actinophytocola sp. TaxID=1872138 RepID=UPI002DBEE7ED|nr:NYN domain-containing protein [Actinophytocola sp.]HEU5474437.1 NYN domain-containing protein [Actinophytocola sp.]
MVRVAAYVDGFNLYFGLKARYGRRHLWLDLQALATSLLRADQSLERLTYFTARVRNNPDSEQRQSDYLDALAVHSPLVTVVDGRFQQKDRRCRSCGDTWVVFEEKETDVNNAVALVEDAVRDRFDTALLLSADSDLCPAVRATKRLRPEKRIIAAFPPSRHSADLRREADGFVHIGDDKIRRAQLPDTLTSGTGIVLRRPAYWS